MPNTLLAEEGIAVSGFKQKTSLGKNLLWYFISVSLAPMIIIGSLSYFSARKTINEKTSRYSTEALRQTTANFEQTLKRYEDISMQLFASPNINSLLEEYIKADQYYEIFNNKIKLEGFLDGIHYNDRSIHGYLFLPKEKKQDFDFVYSTQGKEFFDFMQTFRESDVYEKAVAAGGGVVWSEPMILDRQTKIIAMAREISSTRFGDKLGVFVVCIDERSIDQDINYQLYNENGKLETGEFSLLITETGKVISIFNLEWVGATLEQVMGSNILQSMIDDQQNQGSFFGTIQKKKALINYHKLAINDWIILKIAPTSYLYADIVTVGRVTFLLAVMLLFIVVFISYKISNGISNVLSQVVSVMRQAEAGDLRTRVRIERYDELGNLSWSFNHMADRIVGLIFETKKAITAVFNHSNNLIHSAKQSAQSAESIAVATDEISRGMIEQTNEADRSSQQMSELSAQIEQLLDKAGQVEMIVSSTKALSIRTKETVGLLTDKTNETERISITINKDLTELIMSAEEISKITDLISNISEQTTLLALNAAIEAARAGTAGRGFAVVADEVNKLALESQVAVSTINKILERIDDKSKASSETIQMVKKTMVDQKQAVLLVEKSFEGVISSMNGIVDRLGEISNLIRQINTYKDQTMQSIVSISSVSEETAASSEEVSTAAEEQTNIADQVKTLVGQLLYLAEELTSSINKFRLS